MIAKQICNNLAIDSQATLRRRLTKGWKKNHIRKDDEMSKEINNSVSNNITKTIKLEVSLEDLPNDLLSEIFSRVLVDRHHLVFSLVCKSWNSILQSRTPIEHQLQLGELGATRCSYPHLFLTKDQLIHPILHKVFKLNKFPARTLGVQLCTANEDWLLIAQNCSLDKPSKAFFFNPFTQAIVWLPNFLGFLMPNSVCFTSPLTSDDWKVVVVRKKRSGIADIVNIAIDTIKCGEEKWTTCEGLFEIDELFEFANCNLCLYKDKYYFFANNSKLLIHDPMIHDPKKNISLHETPECISWKLGQQYMLESDGKLLAVLVNTRGDCVRVCQWNLIKMKWEALESLGNHVLFVSRPYSISEIPSASEMANRIYFPRLMNDRCLFYSLETKRFHTSDGSSFTSFDGSQFAFSSTWIKLSKTN